MKNYKISAVGYFNSKGNQNMGDELLLRALKKNFKIDYVIKSDETLNISSFKRILKSKFIFTSGGWFLKTRSTYFLLIYLLIFQRIFLKRIIFFGISSEKLGGVLKLLFKMLLNKSYYIMARDTYTKEYLESITSKEINLGADPSFLLKIEGNKEKNKASDKKKLFIDFVPTRINKEKAEKIIEILIKNEDVEIYLVPFSYRTKTIFRKKKIASDYDFLKSLKLDKRVKIVKIDSLDSMIKELSKADILVCMRLHANILASLLGKPFVSIPYHIKVEEFIKQIKFEKYSLAYKEKNFENKLLKVIELQMNIGETANIKKLREMALVNLKKLKTLMTSA